jgi:hypothetical protein
VLRNTDEFVATVNASPTKRALMAQDLKTQFNMAAVMSSARIDPEGTKQRLIDGEWDLTPKEREQGVAETETQMRAIRSDQIHQRQLADYEERKQNAEESNTLLTKIYKGLVQPGEIANSPLPREIRENLSHFQAWLSEDRLNKLQKPHPVEMLRLWNLVHADVDDPNKIYTNDEVIKSARAGKLNANEAERASEWVAKLKDENGRAIGSRLTNQMNIVSRALSQDPAFIMQPALVAEIQMDYQDRVYEKISEMRKAKKEPMEVFSRTSKDFVGSKEFIQQSIDNVRATNRPLKAVAGQEVVRDGATWRFKGGNPAVESNWEKVAPGGTGSF